jgi:hypothetical protein
MQDARYIIPDVDAPKIPIVVNASLFPVGFDVNVNFGRLIALMCNTGGTLLLPNFQSIFQQVDLRSAYTDDNTDYQTDNTSYHKGSILADLGILGEDYDYAINTPALESFGDKNFNFNNNLSHNYQILLGIATQSFEKTNPDYYVTYTEIGSQYQEYGIGLGAFFICIGMCVGTLTQIMIYDKKKRVRRIRAPK